MHAVAIRRRCCLLHCCPLAHGVTTELNTPCWHQAAPCGTQQRSGLPAHHPTRPPQHPAGQHPLVQCRMPRLRPHPPPARATGPVRGCEGECGAHSPNSGHSKPGAPRRKCTGRLCWRRKAALPVQHPHMAHTAGWFPTRHPQPCPTFRQLSQRAVWYLNCPLRCPRQQQQQQAQQQRRQRLRGGSGRGAGRVAACDDQIVVHLTLSRWGVHTIQPCTAFELTTAGTGAGGRQPRQGREAPAMPHAPRAPASSLPSLAGTHRLQWGAAPGLLIAIRRLSCTAATRRRCLLCCHRRRCRRRCRLPARSATGPLPGPPPARPQGHAGLLAPTFFRQGRFSRWASPRPTAGCPGPIHSDPGYVGIAAGVPMGGERQGRHGLNAGMREATLPSPAPFVAHFQPSAFGQEPPEPAQPPSRDDLSSSFQQRVRPLPEPGAFRP